jgi:hypothetical protein
VTVAEPSTGTPLKLQWLERLAMHQQLKPGDVRVLLRLGRYADQHGRGMFPGPARLTLETGLSESTVKRGLRAGRLYGLIRQSRLGGGKLSSSYEMCAWWESEEATPVSLVTNHRPDHRPDIAPMETLPPCHERHGPRVMGDTPPVSPMTHKACSTPEENPEVETSSSPVIAVAPLAAGSAVGTNSENVLTDDEHGRVLEQLFERYAGRYSLDAISNTLRNFMHYDGLDELEASAGLTAHSGVTGWLDKEQSRLDHLERDEAHARGDARRVAELDQHLTECSLACCQARPSDATRATPAHSDLWAPVANQAHAISRRQTA